MVQFFGNTQPGQVLQVPQQAQRSRALAQQLRQQALTPEQGQMVSGHYVGPGIASAISKLGLGYLSGRYERSAQEQEEAFKQQQQQQQAAFSQALMGQSPGVGPQRPMGQRVQALAQSGNPLAQQFLTSQALRSVEQQQALDTFRRQEQIKASMAKPDLTTEQKNYNFAVSQGYQGTFQQYQNQNRAAGATQVVLPGSKQMTAYEKAAGANRADRHSDLVAAESAARRNAVLFDQAEDLLSQTGSGLGVAARAFVSSRLGVDLGEDATAAQAFQTINEELVQGTKRPGSGTFTDDDARRASSRFPQLLNQPGGNKLILRYLRDVNRYDQEAGRIARLGLDGKLSPPEVDRELSKLRSPLQIFNDFEKMPKSVTPDEFVDMPPEVIESLIQ